MAEHREIMKAPSGFSRLKWLGPAFIWMLSAAGSGELLFTPRIAAQYGYSLIWALIAAVTMKWFINREIGRYTVCTGATFFTGLASIKNRRWLLWLIIIPQLVVAVATIAGLSGAASTAIIVVVDIPLWIPTVLLITLTSLIIGLGGFKSIEKLATVLAIIVSLSVLVAAVSTKPDYSKIAEGFIPTWSSDIKTDEVLPWLGFILAGAAGMMWFSYWTAARGYGAASLKRTEPVLENSDSKTIDTLKDWLTHMTIANTLAVVGALVVAFAFLILGSELLRPEGLVPEENKVAEVLGQLMGGIWGRIGFWFMIGAVFITFVSTVLSDQDGFGRMFADGTRILGAKWNLPEKYTRPDLLKKLFVFIVLALFPMIIYLLAGEPVGLLKLAGAIEAIHIPVVVVLILYLNKKTLPQQLQPSWITFGITALSGLSFAGFAIIYLVQLLGK